MSCGPVVLLVRHAESANNALYNRIVAEMGGASAVALDPALQSRAHAAFDIRRCYDPSLSELGFAQTRLVAQALSMSSGEYSSTTLVFSPMLRACLTAVPIFECLQAQGCAQLSALCHGQYFENGGCHYQGTLYPGRSFKEICTEHASLLLSGMYHRTVIYFYI